MGKSANQQVGKSAKKRRKMPPNAENPPSIPPASQGEESPPNAQLYTKGEWKGLPMWHCTVCGWDTLVSEQEMIEHIEACHTPKPPRKVEVTLPIVDRFGNPIKKEVEVNDG